MRTDRLVHAEQPRNSYRYAVVGRGAFPVDMLRFDAAWPADTESAMGMVADTGARRVELRSYTPPTTGRWISFGWRVE